VARRREATSCPPSRIAVSRRCAAGRAALDAQSTTGQLIFVFRLALARTRTPLHPAALSSSRCACRATHEVRGAVPTPAIPALPPQTLRCPSVVG